MDDERFLSFEEPIKELAQKLSALRTAAVDSPALIEEISNLEKENKKLTKKIYSKLDSWQIVQVARHPNRPHTSDYIHRIFDEFDELDERQVLLVDGLVHRLVVLDPLLEIFVRLFLVRVGAVVLVVHLDLPDVSVDDVWVGAHGLDEQQLQRQSVQRRTDPLPTFLRRVRGVEDGDAAGIRRALLQVTAQVLLEQKVDQIFQRGSGKRPSQRVVLAVAPEELAVRPCLAHHLTSVRAHVEHLGPRAVKEPKILAQPFRHVRLT